MAPIVQAFVAHGRFEVIHPFVDGNGRVGRLLLQHLLAARLDLTSPIPVSVPWSQEPDRYVGALQAYQNGDLNGWIVFTAESTIRAIDWMEASVASVHELLDEFRSGPAAKVGGAGMRAATAAAANHVTSITTPPAAT